MHSNLLSRKPLLLGSLILATALVSSTCLFSQEKSAPEISAPAQTTITEEVRVLDVASDKQIAERIQLIMESVGWFSDIKVKSENGVVTIHGTADTYQHSRWAESIARRTRDTIEVRNGLVVNEKLDVKGAMSVIKATMSRLWSDTLETIPLVVVAFVIYVATWIVAMIGRRIVKRGLRNKRNLRANLVELLGQLTGIAIWIIGLTIIGIILFPGLTPTRALTALGIGSVAIGFAFKDIFENFFAGVLILWRYPFDRGDILRVGDVMGRVQNITIRNTLILRPEGELVVVPNATMFKSNVEVLTHRKERRVRMSCPIAYHEDMEKVTRIIHQAVACCASVRFEKQVEVCVSEFGESSVVFSVLWWAGAEPRDCRASKHEVICAVKKALDEAGIEIPFPYLNITMKKKPSNKPSDQSARASEAN